MSLTNGELRAKPRYSDAYITNATAVQSGETLRWGTSTMYAVIAAPVYSVVRRFPADEFGVLAAYGQPDMWSLCPSSAFRGQTNVYFNLTLDNSGGLSPDVTFSECYKVLLNLIPL